MANKFASSRKLIIYISFISDMQGIDCPSLPVEWHVYFVSMPITYSIKIYDKSIIILKMFVFCQDVNYHMNGTFRISPSVLSHLYECLCVSPPSSRLVLQYLGSFLLNPTNVNKNCFSLFILLQQVHMCTYCVY